MDDDPLTSPSFPAINTSDSRSYRTRSRSSSQGSGSPANGSLGNGYGETVRQISGYAISPDHSISTPNSHAIQSAPSAARPGPVPPATAPAASPYGSYADGAQPRYSELASAHLDAAGYGTGYAAGQQAVAAANWYGGAEPNHSADGYLPGPHHDSQAQAGEARAAYGAVGYAGYAPADYANGYQASAYQPQAYQAQAYQTQAYQAEAPAYQAPAYQASAYQAPAYQAPAYQGGQNPAAGGYGQFAGQYDQSGYASSDAGYSQDGYDPYPGYGEAAG